MGGRALPDRDPRYGFTLLEVMVSLSILALALTTLAGINANSFEASNYAKHLTVATLLARSKMIDVEEELRKDGFGDDDKEFDGDFEEEGFPKFTWVATARKVELNIGQLLGGLMGGGEGDVSTESLPEQMQAFLGAMSGEGTDELVDQVGGSELSQLMGGGMGEQIFKQIGENIGKSIREITLEIKWGKEGVDEETLKFVQYVTTTGRIASLPSTIGLPSGTLPGGRNPKTILPPTLPGGGKNPATKFPTHKGK